ncbi:MAG: metallophosphoesterase [Chloroflexi bacterium]|nr:metallophosphoesterase [Chloroflexota bacterium]
MQAASRRYLAALAALAIGVALLIAPRVGSERVYHSPGPLPTYPAEATVLLAVGDIGSCGTDADEAVAALAARLPGTIALLGDIAYDDGSQADFKACFDPAWGTLRPRIRPAPGNHEYATLNATGYFSYFGAVAGTPGEGWYSYDLGTWHVIVLNSNCEEMGSCGSGSPQLTWLVADLAAHPAKCTVAYWHHPRYSSGHHGSDVLTEPFWQALADAGADVVLEGHDHDYERLAPVEGIRSFVVGTGGHSLYDWRRLPGPFTELRDDSSYGLLALELDDGVYRWRFVSIPGDSLSDAGSGTCR